MGDQRLPMALVAALQTRRPQLIKPLEHQIRNGEVALTNEDAADMIKAFADLIEMWDAQDAKLRRLTRIVREVENFGKGLLGHATKLQVIIDGVDDDGK